MLRNLSWRADVNSKKTLREVGSVRALMGCALEVQKVSETCSSQLLTLICTERPHTLFSSLPGVDSEVCTERALEPVGSLYREQGGHLCRGRRSGLLGGNADPPQSHQHACYHRERWWNPAQCLQPHCHQRGAQVNTCRQLNQLK